MDPIWRRVFSRTNTDRYDFSRLIDYVQRESDVVHPSRLHIICDIDKTYLETEFESFLRMARVAFESPEAKITVRGASDVLLAARWGDQTNPGNPEQYPRGLHFVSSSPPQLRSVLEQKLSLDGLDWTSDTFKNQAYNVLKRRIDQLRQHVGYKSAAILRVIRSQGEGQTFYMIGDNAESDTFIYLGIALRLSGQLDQDAYADYLGIAGIEADVAREISSEFANLPASEVAGIFIRNAPGYKFIDAPPLTTGVKLFDHYFQVALLLLQHQMIPVSLIQKMVRTYHNQYSYERDELAAELAALRRDAERDRFIDEITAALKAIRCEKIKPSATDYRCASIDKSLSASDILDQAKQWFDRMHSHKLGLKKR